MRVRSARGGLARAAFRRSRVLCVQLWLKQPMWLQHLPQSAASRATELRAGSLSGVSGLLGEAGVWLGGDSSGVGMRIGDRSARFA